MQRRRRAAVAAADAGGRPPLYEFLLERVRYVLEQRGFDVRNVRAVTSGIRRGVCSPLQARRKLEVLPEFTESADFKQLAVLFKRVRNIAQNLDPAQAPATDPTIAQRARPSRPKWRCSTTIEAREPAIDAAVASGQGFRQAFGEAAASRSGGRRSSSTTCW